MPVIVLAGEEDFELYRRVDKLKLELIDPAWSAFNFARLDNPDLPEIIDAAQTLPFGPGKRMVLIDRCELFTKKKGKAGGDSDRSEKTVKTLLEGLDQALGSVSPDTYVVFACPHNFDSTLRTSKVVSAHADIVQFPRTQYWAGSHNPTLETWCQKEAHARGATINGEALTYLLDSTEANLRQVASEIEKAAVYALPGTHITLETVSAVSSHHSHVFSLLNHWAQGERKLALKSLEELIARQNAIQILATLNTFVSKWIRLKALIAREEGRLPGGAGVKRRELPPQELARRLAGEIKGNPRAIEMDLKRVRPLSMERLVDKRHQLCELERLVKTGQMPDHHALSIFLTS